jgi:hypothetical protein
MFTFLAALFALGTIWFWALLLLDFIIITALVENEKGFWATVVFIGSLIGLDYLWKLPILQTIQLNPLKFTELVSLYFGLGIGWSILKWYLFTTKEKFRYNEYKADFLSKRNAKELTPALASALQDSLAGQPAWGSYKISAVPPSAREHKADLTRWATYWPMSMIGFALNDVVRKSWRYIITMLQSTYQRISNHVFRGASADMALATKFKEDQAVEQAAKAGASQSDRPLRVRPNN